MFRNRFTKPGGKTRFRSGGYPPDIMEYSVDIRADETQGLPPVFARPKWLKPAWTLHGLWDYSLTTRHTCISLLLTTFTRAISQFWSTSISYKVLHGLLVLVKKSCMKTTRSSLWFAWSTTATLRLAWTILEPAWGLHGAPACRHGRLKARDTRVETVLLRLGQRGGRGVGRGRVWCNGQEGRVLCWRGLVTPSPQIRTFEQFLLRKCWVYQLIRQQKNNLNNPSNYFRHTLVTGN